MSTITVRDALVRVTRMETPSTDIPLDMPVWELISWTLFDIANGAHPEVRGSVSRANRARRAIMQRLDGRRRAGTHPAVRKASSLQFVDLTTGELDD